MVYARRLFLLTSKQILALVNRLHFRSAISIKLILLITQILLHHCALENQESHACVNYLHFSLVIELVMAVNKKKVAALLMAHLQE